MSAAQYKVIVTGPVGAGKTTAVQSVTDNKTLVTDKPATDVTGTYKGTTTVAMDYGVVQLSATELVHVYGTPGQERFDFMWDILTRGGNGLIILLDNRRNNPFRDMKRYTSEFAHFIENNQLVIGVTHCDHPGAASLDQYQQWAKELLMPVEIVQVDARHKADILSLIIRVLEPCRQSQTQHVDNPLPLQLEVPANFTGEETLLMNDDVLGRVGSIQGVSGVTLSSAMGELLNSTIEDEALNEFIAFLSGMSDSLEETAALGRIGRILLKSPTDDNLSIFIEQDKTLGVKSHPKASLHNISQQVEDLLQWG